MKNCGLILYTDLYTFMKAYNISNDRHRPPRQRSSKHTCLSHKRSWVRFPPGLVLCFPSLYVSALLLCPVFLCFLPFCVYSCRKCLLKKLSQKIQQKQHNSLTQKTRNPRRKSDAFFFYFYFSAQIQSGIATSFREDSDPKRLQICSNRFTTVYIVDVH